MKFNRKLWDLTIDSIIAMKAENDPVSQKWFLKDVIAHVSWYDKELLDALETRSIVESEFWNMDVEARNEFIFANTQDQTFPDLLKQSKTTFDKLLKTIETISDEDLNSDIYVKRKEGTRIIHDFIGGITYWHYEEHHDRLIDVFDLDYGCSCS